MMSSNGVSIPILTSEATLERMDSKRSNFSNSDSSQTATDEKISRQSKEICSDQEKEKHNYDDKQKHAIEDSGSKFVGNNKFRDLEESFSNYKIECQYQRHSKTNSVKTLTDDILNVSPSLSNSHSHHNCNVLPAFLTQDISQCNEPSFPPTNFNSIYLDQNNRSFMLPGEIKLYDVKSSRDSKNCGSLQAATSLRPTTNYGPVILNALNEDNSHLQGARSRKVFEKTAAAGALRSSVFWQEIKQQTSPFLMRFDERSYGVEEVLQRETYQGLFPTSEEKNRWEVKLAGIEHEVERLLREGRQLQERNGELEQKVRS